MKRPARTRKEKRGKKGRKVGRRRPRWSTGEGRPGLVHVYTGDGKGKTTAAIGIVVRAHGQGLRCCIVQFMKGRYPYGEVKVLRRLKGVTVRQFGTLEFVRKGRQRRVDMEEAGKALDFSRRAMASGRYDLVVLDEVNVAVFMDLLPAGDVVDAVRARADGVEVVLTGRRAHRRLVSMADYVTRFEKGAHPFDEGTMARKGIEF